jgi:polyphosphate kinase
MTIHALDRPDLKDAPFLPAVPARLRRVSGTASIFAAIRKGDLLLHHPYDSFAPVVDFVTHAARDRRVLAIKQTLYRVGKDSPVVDALLEAPQTGKEVAALLELKARFDEESNIEWARALEREGVHVIYGLIGLKTHAKALLVVRREGGHIRRYVHLATGNYNVSTAQVYTDLGLLTCDEAIGADVTDLFNYLTGYSAKASYRKLLVAPVNLRARIEEKIRREIDLRRKGEPAHLIFKMNALVDRRMIQLLYEASREGVEVDLIVRGICCLRPGLEGVSERIRVRSIVGRFLEHSRVYYFRNGGAEDVYLGSADLMPRNLDHRVEVLFPVEDPSLVRVIRDEVLGLALRDNVRARRMLPDGRYERVRPPSGEPLVDSQAWLLASRSAAPAE